MKIDKFSCSIRGILAASSLVLLMGLIGCDGDESSGFEARIEASVLDSNAPIEISFRAVSQAPLDSELTYAWSFGDGEEGTGAEPNHTFSAPGEYTVSVSITSSDGSTGRDSVTVSLGEPTDLSVENIQLSSSRAAPGESLEVTWLLKNAAAQARAPVGTAVFLSVDELFDDNDRLLSRVTVAGNEVTSDGIGQSATVTIPDDAGTGVAFIIVVTDDRGLVGDIDRSNNTGLSSMPFRIRGETDSAPDLVVCGLSITGIDELSLEIQPVVEQTDQLEMEVCIANLGDRPTPSASYAIYLSEDETLDDNDLQIALKPGEALGVGERFNMVETIDFSTIDLGDNWHILVQVDPNDEASEQREDNNVAAYRRSFQVVEGGMVEGVDLLVPSVNVSQARVFWGQILSGSLTIQNRGSQSVERIFLVRLSLRPADGGAPVPLTSLNLDGLPSGESREEAFEVTLSQRVPQGEYTLVAEVDPTNSVGDVNEANNTRFFTMMLTLGGEPNIDLLPLAVELDRDTVAAGGMVEVRVRLANEGIDASGPFDVDLILSRDNAGSNDDTQLGRFRVENLAGTAESELVQSVVIPEDIDQAVDRWLVGASVDPENRIRGEAREDNNIRFSPTQLQVSGATGGCREDNNEPNDSRGEAVPVAVPGINDLGACGNVDWFSVDVPPNSLLSVTVSEDTMTNSIRMRLVDAAGQSLAEASRGSSRLNAFAITSEMPDVVFIEVSAGIPEVAYDLGLTIADRGIEGHLKAQNIAVSPTVAQAGQAVQVSGRILNVGTATVLPTEVGFFVSSTPGSLGATFLEGVELEQLEAGASETFSVNVTLPPVLEDGAYFITAKPDVGGVTNSSLADDEAWDLLVVDEQGACTADTLEPNQSPHVNDGQGSGIVERVQPGDYEDLWVCNTDDDWYAVELEAGQRLSASVSYTVSDGDVELSLYGSDGRTVLDESASLLGVENVELSRVTQSGVYFLRVFLKTGSPRRENSYSLSLAVGDADACPDDTYEPNGERMSAPLLRDGTHDLFLCESDQDWYRFAIAAGNTVSWQLTSGDAPLRMFLYDESGLVGESDRRIVHQARRNGTHYLQVVADVPGEYAYQIRSSGVSGVDLALGSISSSRASVTPGSGFRISGQVENRRGDFATNVLVQSYLSSTPEDYESGILLGETTVSRIDGAGVEAFSMRVQAPGQQSLNMLGISSPGEGHITAVVDPDRSVPDAQFSNNVLSTDISFVQGCVDDDPNDNEGPTTASQLGALSLITDVQATICPYTEDWYAIEVDQTGGFTISLRDFAGGDLDLSVYDANQLLLASSATEAPVEQVEIDIDSTNNPIVYIRVDGFEESASDYRLTWGQP